MNDTKKWFLVVTQRNCEEKVARLLLRKKIEAFCPMSLFRIHEQADIFNNRPLLSSLIFVRVSEPEIEIVLKTTGVKHFLHRFEKPAVISHDDVLHVAGFSRLYHDIEVEKCNINLRMDIQSSSERSQENGNEYMNLPSMGLKLIARQENYRLRKLYPSLQEYKKTHFALNMQ